MQSKGEYTKEETQFLTDNYKTMKNKDLAINLGRKIKSIEKKLKRLELRRQPWRLWSDEDIAFLKDNYDKMSRVEMGKHVGREFYNVVMKMVELGLTTQIKKWTKEDEEFLCDNYPHGEISKIADNLKCSINTVCLKAKKLNLKQIQYKHKEVWTEKETTYLQDNYKTVGCKQVALNLQCSVLSVNRKIREIENKIKTEKNMSFVKENYDKITYKEMAKRLGISLCMVRRLATKCGYEGKSFTSENVKFLKENAIIELTYSEISEKISISVDDIKDKCKELNCNNSNKELFREKRKQRKVLRSVLYRMINRCHNKQDKDYKIYGAKGIVVCQEWRENKREFCKFAINNGWEKGKHTHRIDHTKGYNPDNVCFISRHENCRYTSQTVLNEEKVFKILDLYCLEKMTQCGIAKKLNINTCVISSVLNKRAWVDITERWEVDHNIIVIVRKKKSVEMNIEQRIKRVFVGMKERCYNPNSTSYNRYGGRGIRVCDEWLHDPNLFVKYALDNGWSQGKPVNRINNDGNYEPGNVNFISFQENAQNTSQTKINPGLVYKILDMYYKQKLSIYKIMYKLGLGKTSVSDVVNMKTWTNISKEWNEKHMASLLE